MSIGVITELAKHAARLTDMAGPNGSRFMLHSATGIGSIEQSVFDHVDKVIFTTDFETHMQAMMACMSDPSRFYLNNKESFKLTVGVGGQFGSINAAIDAAVRMRPVHNQGLGNCTIELVAGTVVEEQVLIMDGSDLGWIRITAVDPDVLIDHNFITQYLSEKDDSIPAFGAIDNSVLPVIGAKFHYLNNTVAKDGVAVLQGSKVAHMPNGCGVHHARRGLLISYNSESHCYPLGLTQGGDGIGAGGATGADYSYARLRGMHVAYGSRACMGRSNFSHCDGDFGVYVIWMSTADCYHSNASWTLNGTGFHARDGSTMNCRESNYSHCRRGVHALHVGRINARSRINSPTVGQWIGEGAKYCTEYAVLASNCSEIEAAELDASFCTGSAAISASDTSRVNFISGVATDCTFRAVWAQTCSNVNATGATVSRSTIGLWADAVSNIAAVGVIAIGCVSYGALALAGGSIVVNDGDLSGCGRGIEPREGGRIIARNANLSKAIERGVSCIDGGHANIQEANVSDCVSRAVTCRGGDVVATRANLSGATNWGIEVFDGGIVKAVGANIGTSPLSQTPNTITAKGIIFYEAVSPPEEP